MADESIQIIEGSGNMPFQNITASTINATLVIGKSGKYRTLADHLRILEELFKNLPRNDAAKRLEISGKINEQRALMESFKQDVMRLAETFNRVELSTERLKKAKEHFENGEIMEARVLLEDAEEERLDTKKRALAKEKDYKENVLPTLRTIADEYLIMAQTTALNYEDSDRFEKACHYFRASIESNRNLNNLFEFAKFLHEHNQIDEAKTIYMDLLEHFAPDAHSDERATILNNLGILYMNNTEPDLAVKAFQRALEILRALATENYLGFIPKVALTLSNVGLLHTYHNAFEEADEELTEALAIYRDLISHNEAFFGHYLAATLNNKGILNKRRKRFAEAKDNYYKALGIRRELAKKDPHSHKPDIAMLLTNLGNLTNSVIPFKEREDAFLEALKIYRQFAQKDPHIYEPFLSVTLHNLGTLYAQEGNFPAAKQQLENALSIRRVLTKNNPQRFEIDLAGTLANLSAVFTELRKEKDETVSLALEALTILFPYYKIAPYTKEAFHIAYNAMIKAKFSPEEIQQKVAEMIAEKEAES